MADVGPRRPPRSGRHAGAGGERGQLILVTALSMAILFVALALILNTAIYTENLATRSGDIGGATDAVRYHDAARAGVGGVIEYVNVNNNTDHQTLRENLSAGVASYRNLSARQFSQGDRAVETTLNATDHGTRIAQDDESRNFTNQSGANADWELVSNVENTRGFKLNVSDDELLDTSFVLGDRFYVEVNDGSNQWKMYIYEEGTSDITVEVVNASGGGGTCTASSVDSVWINVTAGTVGGQECPYLVFGEGLSGTYDITFRNPTEASGTYTLVVDNDALAGSPGPHLEEDGDGQPFAAHAIYSATVDVVYETSRLHYEATVRVAPEEADG